MKQTYLILLMLTSWTLNAQRATVTPTNIEILIASENNFALHYASPAPASTKWFEYQIGKRNILVIAGHASAQLRDGSIKQADAGTGSLAIELNRTCSVPIFFTTYLSPSDPNYYDNNEFKDSLAKILDIIKPILVLDLHGSHPYRPYDIDFGTMQGKSYLTRKDFLEKMKLNFANEGLINQSQDYFSADKNQTITKFVSSKGVPCIQLEINSNYLSPDMGNIYAQKSAQLLHALIQFINETTQ